jgi:hypothetical protein
MIGKMTRKSDGKRATDSADRRIRGKKYRR